MGGGGQIVQATILPLDALAYRELISVPAAAIKFQQILNTGRWWARYPYTLNYVLVNCSCIAWRRVIAAGSDYIVLVRAWQAQLRDNLSDVSA